MKKVLVLGAGMVARPLVRYLLDRDFAITQGDIAVENAAAMIDGHPNGTAITLDISNDDELKKLISNHDLTVSLVPFQFHPLVARHCLDAGKPMVTASYVSDEMSAMHDEAVEKGVTLLNEIGVDPGIDHMSAMRVIDAVHAKGGSILSFRSYCGGLPAPEAMNNPFGYKFSWAPRGVMVASRNGASYLQHGLHVEIEPEMLFRDMHILHVDNVGEFEAYPNRDSLSYIDIYGIGQEIRTMFRGTLRNMGWCDTLHNFRKFGLLSLQEIPGGATTYVEMIRALSGCDENADVAVAVADKLGLCPKCQPVNNMSWLGFFEDRPLGDAETPLDALSVLMQERLAYADGERDMLVMKHQFVAIYPDGHREQLVSQMVDYGISGGDSSMARTVSLPVAIAVRMILEETITAKGVLRPITSDIYNPVLDELEELGIVCEEKIEIIEPGSV
ncbi:saccharopine dehydrogenase [bacterium]|nr:saccharopine dehydrogenase [bacterium]